MLERLGKNFRVGVASRENLKFDCIRWLALQETGFSPLSAFESVGVYQNGNPFLAEQAFMLELNSN